AQATPAPTTPPRTAPPATPTTTSNIQLEREPFEFPDDESPLSIFQNNILRTGTGSLTRFLRAGIWRIPTGDIERLDPRAGVGVAPAASREDAEALGATPLNQADANPHEPEAGYAPEAHAGQVPEMYGDTDSPYLEGEQTLGYDYAPPEVEYTAEENITIIDENEAGEPSLGENPEDTSENQDDEEPNNNDSEGQDDNPSQEDDQPAPADYTPESPDAADANDDEENGDSESADQGADEGTPEQGDEDDQPAQIGDDEDEADENNNEDEQDGEAADNDDDDTTPLPPHAAHPSTQNPLTGDNFAVLGLAFSTLGFITSSLILVITIFERKAKK
ncbi:MAG: hypothetical protein FWB74_08640, partial [Defluviitaleaceae bacterium]|nr:hypothetical protein [Defluviitaleaceae bacterium]